MSVYVYVKDNIKWCTILKQVSFSEMEIIQSLSYYFSFFSFLFPFIKIESEDRHGNIES